MAGKRKKEYNEFLEYLFLHKFTIKESDNNVITINKNIDDNHIEITFYFNKTLNRCHSILYTINKQKIFLCKQAYLNKLMSIIKWLE